MTAFQAMTRSLEETSLYHVCCIYKGIGPNIPPREVTLAPNSKLRAAKETEPRVYINALSIESPLILAELYRFR